MYRPQICAHTNVHDTFWRGEGMPPLDDKEQIGCARESVCGGPAREKVARAASAHIRGPGYGQGVGSTDSSSD